MTLVRPELQPPPPRNNRWAHHMHHTQRPLVHAAPPQPRRPACGSAGSPASWRHTMGSTRLCRADCTTAARSGACRPAGWRAGGPRASSSTATATRAGGRSGSRATCAPPSPSRTPPPNPSLPHHAALRCRPAAAPWNDRWRPTAATSPRWRLVRPRRSGCASTGITVPPPSRRPTRSGLRGSAEPRAVAGAARTLMMAVRLSACAQVPPGAGEPAVVTRPFVSEEGDHCETPRLAYEDVAAVLRELASRLGKPPAELVLYDPYYCDGAMRTHLAAVGFPRCVPTERRGRSPRGWRTNSLS